jgi:uncharacterized protein GlcG (DUF336 family)
MISAFDFKFFKGRNPSRFRPTDFARFPFCYCWSTVALWQLPNPYGLPISVDKKNWTVALAIVDTAGNLVSYEKMDGTQLGSANMAITKARCAALFKHPTKAFEDALAGGGAGLRVLRLEGVVPVEGGIPIVMDRKIVGAIGVSGDTSAMTASARKRSPIRSSNLEPSRGVWSNGVPRLFPRLLAIGLRVP